jgi:CTP:molybdopterin cytidylyltransferase MocA
MDAVILGGGGVEDWFASEGAPNKGMLDINGKPCVWYTINSLKSTPGIDRIILIGDNYTKEIIEMVDQNCSDGGSLKRNVDMAFDVARSDTVLIATSDTPLVTPQTFQTLMECLKGNDADLILPLLTKEDTQTKFPGTKRTYAKLREGKVKVSNCFLLKREAYVKVEPVVAEVQRRRKSAIKQAMQLGFGFILKLLFGTATIPQLQNKVESILHIKVSAPFVPLPELGVDVDKPSDLVFCRNFLKEHSK